MHPEVARRRALEPEPRRSPELGRDVIALVAPCGEKAFRCEDARYSFERVGARVDVAEPRDQRQTIAIRPEDVTPCCEAGKAGIVEQAGRRGANPERSMAP